MKHIFEFSSVSVAAVAWLAGMVLAQGSGEKALAVFIPFYAWYLVGERAMQLWGILP